MILSRECENKKKIEQKVGGGACWWAPWRESRWDGPVGWEGDGALNEPFDLRQTLKGKQWVVKIWGKWKGVLVLYYVVAVLSICISFGHYCIELCSSTYIFVCPPLILWGTWGETGIDQLVTTYTKVFLYQKTKDLDLLLRILKVYLSH